MAKIKEIADQASWFAWVESRPPVVQELCRLLPPDRLYLLKSSGHRVTLLSYSENRTVTVAVTGEFNSVVFDRQVFGIKPEDLEECELPADNEQLGTMLTERQDVEEYVDFLRPAVLAASNGQTDFLSWVEDA